MTPYLADPDFTLWHGDVRDVLPTLESESVDCALTSPPFYALRDYGVQGQIGLEATPDEWVAELVAVFRELRRVLKPQGTLWVECGDSYAANRSYQVSQTKHQTHDYGDSNAIKAPPGYKPKDLIGAPWLLAFALRADGWYLRQCIVWAKPNAMPESVRDRCTTAHSYVFLLSKQPRYWFDADAISEPAEWARWGDQTVPKYNGTDTSSGWMQPKTKAELIARGGRTTNGQRERSTEMRGFDNRLDRADGQKNARSVWTIPTQGYPDAHFATWPEALVERIIKAGCPEWVCGTCGKARERLTEREGIGAKRIRNECGRTDGYTHIRRVPGGATSPTVTTVGWSDCGCGAAPHAYQGITLPEDAQRWQPGVILDPFMGSGTTALVARRLGRKSIGIELNEDYCAMAARRLQQLSLLAEGAA